MPGWLERLLETLREHDAWVWPITILSIVLALGSLVAVRVVVARLPADHFTHGPAERRRRSPLAGRPLLWAIVIGGRNVVGWALVLAGLAMLVLPGQGLLTIAVGVLLADFPGKHALEDRLVRRRAIARALQWIRRRSGKPPLEGLDADARSPGGPPSDPGRGP